MSTIGPTGSLPERPASIRHRRIRVVLTRDEVGLTAVKRAVADLLVALGKTPLDPLSDTATSRPLLRRVAHPRGSST
jgi:hypothetical protein